MTAARVGTRLAIDIGGTFTDVVLRDGDGRLRTTKVPTTPDHINRGIIHGIEQIGEAPASLEAFIHGTTIALNALLESKTPPVGLITTLGFRDVIEIMRTNRPDMYDLQQDKPVPPVPRRWRREISARMAASGETLSAVQADEVREIALDFAAAGVTTIAVCLLNAYANPEHEHDVAAVLRDVVPDAVVSLSTDVNREWREFERTSTTVINAATKPIMSTYLTELEELLADRAFGGEVLIMQSNGGVMSATEARARPVATLMSGPVGGVAAAVEIAHQAEPPSNLVTLDIGGTSADVAVIVAGEPASSTVGRIGAWPVMVPMIDISSIGAGGGSIARVDSFGSLSVGPDSAGAVPGPACYGRGGSEATVTDANVLLGRINPEYFLGGDFGLDVAAAERALQSSVAMHYEMTIQEAARGVITVVNSNMTRLVWEEIIGRGHDPRDFSLVAFGGAGGLHACELALSLGIREVVVPPEPGGFSAVGMTAADIRHDVSQTLVESAAGAANGEVHAALAELEQAARARLEREGLGYGHIDVVRMLELRYTGQRRGLTVELPDRGSADAGPELEAAHAKFHDQHQRLYGFSRDDAEVELLRVQISVIGKVKRLPLLRLDPEQASPGNAPSTRRLSFDDGFHDVPVWRRAALEADAQLPGPCTIEEPGSTTYVPSGCEAAVDQHHNLRIVIPPSEGVAS